MTCDRRIDLIATVVLFFEVPLYALIRRVDLVPRVTHILDQEKKWSLTV